MTHCDQILAHLREGKTITDGEARAMFGCNRLAARIHDLRQRGHNIKDETITVKNRIGKDCRVARYSLALPKPKTTLFDVTTYQRVEVRS